MIAPRKLGPSLSYILYGAPGRVFVDSLQKKNKCQVSLDTWHLFFSWQLNIFVDILNSNMCTPKS